MNLPDLNSSPFDLANNDAYRYWRDDKLEKAARSPGELVVEISDPGNISAAEHEALMLRLRHNNMALYDTGGTTISKAEIRALGRNFGLVNLDANPYSDEDAVTSLKVKPLAEGAVYIPYTSRAISWHTDGYYNSAKRQVRGIILHCARPAVRGGGNALMDVDMAYIHLRERNPDYIHALCHENAMSIPRNEVNDFIEREESTGPVFSVLESRALHMRFTARKRYISWRDDVLTRKAVAELMKLLNSDTPYIYRHLMQAGQGLIGNNPLHDRAEFSDSEEGGGAGRLLYRARYYDRIAEEKELS